MLSLYPSYICLSASDIVFDSDIALQWYLPFGQVMDKYLNFGWKPKYNFDEVKI